MDANKKTIKHCLLLFIFCVTHLTFAQTPPPLKKVDVEQYQLMPSSSKIFGVTNITTVKFNLEGNKILFRSGSHSAKACNVYSGETLWEVEGSEYEPMASTILASDPRFVIIGNNIYAGGKIKMLTWDDGKEAGSLSPYASGRNGLDYFSFWGDLAWTGPNGNIMSYSFKSNTFGSKGFVGHDSEIWALKFDWIGNIITAGLDGKIMKWNSVYPKDKESPRTFQRDSSELIYASSKKLISLATFQLKKGDSNPSDIIVAGGNHGTVLLISTKTKQLVHQFELPDGTVTNLKYHPTDNDILVATGKNHIYFYSFSRKQIIRTIQTTGEIYGFDMTYNGDKIAVGMADGVFQMWSLPREKRDIMAFDLYVSKTTAPESLTGSLTKYMSSKVVDIECMNILSVEERSAAAKESGTFVGNWASNPYLAERTIKGIDSVDGYITSALMDSDKNSGGYVLSFAYFTKSEGKVNYMSKEVTGNIEALKAAMDEHISEVCKFVR
ncbi:hypothetical protein [Reichenbachiella sp. MALMAid0571]|uniref:WD40 repeat domain-containing protein n=1 Tax=Reichenbachiella sp. MALMAid0571 TaxID=3143939 RepID=UPI0032E003F2